MFTITDEGGTHAFSSLDDAKWYAEAVFRATGHIVGIVKE